MAEESGELIRQEHLFQLKNPKVHGRLGEAERWEEPEGSGLEEEGSGQEEDEGSGQDEEGRGQEDEGSDQEGHGYVGEQVDEMEEGGEAETKRSGGAKEHGFEEGNFGGCPN